MKRAVLFLGFFCFLFAPVASARAADEAAVKKEAIGVVSHFYDVLQKVMKQGTELGYRGRFAHLAPVVRESYDMETMTRLAVGPAWAQASAAQRKALIDAFANYSIANYASSFKKYDGEVFSVLGANQARGRSVLVETTLTPQGERPVAMNYMMRLNKKGEPRIVDVLLDGSISQLAMRRSEFAAVLKTEGFPGLVALMKSKVGLLDKNP